MCADYHAETHRQRVGVIDEPAGDENYRGGKVACQIRRASICRRTEKTVTRHQEEEQHKRARARSEEAVVNADGENADDCEQIIFLRDVNVAGFFVGVPIFFQHGINSNDNEHDDDERSQEVGRDFLQNHDADN